MVSHHSVAFGLNALLHWNNDTPTRELYSVVSTVYNLSSLVCLSQAVSVPGLGGAGTRWFPRYHQNIVAFPGRGYRTATASVEMSIFSPAIPLGSGRPALLRLDLGDGRLGLVLCACAPLPAPAVAGTKPGCVLPPAACDDVPWYGYFRRVSWPSPGRPRPRRHHRRCRCRPHRTLQTGMRGELTGRPSWIVLYIVAQGLR